MTNIENDPVMDEVMDDMWLREGHPEAFTSPDPAEPSTIEFASVYEPSRIERHKLAVGAAIGGTALALIGFGSGAIAFHRRKTQMA